VRSLPDERDPLHESVNRFGERRRRFRREQGRSLGLALSMVGLGWLVVIPALLGLFVGRWLDTRFGTGLTLRAGLGLLGLAFGCAAAWKRVARRARG
jgi:ATP synthase protein I